MKITDTNSWETELKEFGELAVFLIVATLFSFLELKKLGNSKTFCNKLVS